MSGILNNWKTMCGCFRRSAFRNAPLRTEPHTESGKKAALKKNNRRNSANPCQIIDVMSDDAKDTKKTDLHASSDA